MKYTTALIVAFAVPIVLSSGCRSMTGRSLGTNIDDKTITASVKTKLGASQLRSITWVDVDTKSGVVYLSGNVASAADRERAEQVASSAGGVRGVVNNLQVVPSDAKAAGTAPGTEPEAGTKRAVAASPATAGGGAQRLSGEVTAIDHASGQVSVRTTNGELTLQLPPAAVRNVQQGDRLSVDVGVVPGR